MESDPDDYTWIIDSQKLDGSLGNGLLDTLGALLYLQLPEEQKNKALAYIVSQQNNRGDFDNNIYISALALQALSQEVSK